MALPIIRTALAEARKEEVDSSSSIPVLKESSQRWWLLLLLFTAMLISYMQRGALSVAAPFMGEELHLSKTGLGIVLSSFFWAYTLMQVPAGLAVDRIGVKRAYSVGFVFWSLAATLTGLTRGVASLIGLRVAMGAGQSITFPATARAVANSYPDRERGSVTAIYLIGVRLGQALVSLLGGYFLARYNWKLFFLVTGLIPLVWLLPWNRFLNRWEIPAPVNQSQPDDPNTSLLVSLALLKQRSVLGIFLGFFAYDYAWYVFITWLPGYLVLERKFTPREMGVYSAAPFLAMSVIILLSGLISDWLIRTGREEKKIRKAFIITGLAIACLIVPAGMVTDKMTSVWLLTISLCGLGVSAPNTWTLTQAVCDKRFVGTVTGIQNFGGNLSGIIAPALTGFIAETTDSFSLAMGLTGAILCGGIIAYWILISDRVRVA